MYQPHVHGMLSEEQKDFICIAYQSEEHNKEIDKQGTHHYGHLRNIPFRAHHKCQSNKNNTSRYTYRFLSHSCPKLLKQRIFAKERPQKERWIIVQKIIHVIAYPPEFILTK